MNRVITSFCRLRRWPGTFRWLVGLLSRAAVFAALAAVVGVGLTSTGCSLFRSEGTLRVDSVSVTASNVAGSVDVRVFGWGNTACVTLKRVERSTRQDTLVRRLIGESEGGNCLQTPVRLIHDERVSVSVQRPVVYAVKQPDGSELTRELSIP